MSKATPDMTHRAYSVIKREGQDDFWLPIGGVFAHQDGNGFNVILQALPIDGKLVLRVPKSEEEEQRPKPRSQEQQTHKSGYKRR